MFSHLENSGKELKCQVLFISSELFGPIME